MTTDDFTKMNIDAWVRYKYPTPGHLYHKTYDKYKVIRKLNQVEHILSKYQSNHKSYPGTLFVNDQNVVRNILYAFCYTSSGLIPCMTNEGVNLLNRIYEYYKLLV